MADLEFGLPTALQSGRSIDSVGANLDHFGEDEDEVWVIEGKKDERMCSPSHAYC